MIQFDRVSKRYESGHDALTQVSFDIADEEMVFLTGHSGAGKSTLLKLIALIERPTRGSILVNDRNTAKIGRFRVPYYRREIGIVFQNNRLLMDRTVFDNVALPLVVSGCHHRELGRRVRAALDKVGLLKKERDLPITLSGGEQQRVAVARALAGLPEVVLADEPTGNLDDATGKEIHELIRSLAREEQRTFVVVTHKREFARYADRVLQLADKRLSQLS